MQVHPLLTRALLLGLTLLAACASPPAPPPPARPQASVDAQRQAEFDQSQQRWHGASVQELVAKLGKPSSIARGPEGEQVYVYARAAKLGGPNGSIFSCVVRYQLDAKKNERVVGHRIEGC